MKKTENSNSHPTSSNGSLKGKATKASCVQTTKIKPATSKSKSSKPRRLKTVWGKANTISEQRKFQAYLEKLTTARDITSHGHAGVVWLKSLPPRKKDRIKKRLREVDPKGYAELLAKQKRGASDA